jgi:hypothetical protein
VRTAINNCYFNVPSLAQIFSWVFCFETFVIWGHRTSGMWRRVAGWFVPDVPRQTSGFNVKGRIVHELSALVAETTTLSRNVRRQSSDASAHSKRTEISSALRRKPKTRVCNLFGVLEKGWSENEVIASCKSRCSKASWVLTEVTVALPVQYRYGITDFSADRSEIEAFGISGCYAV